MKERRRQETIYSVDETAKNFAITFCNSTALSTSHRRMAQLIHWACKKAKEHKKTINYKNQLPSELNQITNCKNITSKEGNDDAVHLALSLLLLWVSVINI